MLLLCFGPQNTYLKYGRQFQKYSVYICVLNISTMRRLVPKFYVKTKLQSTNTENDMNYRMCDLYLY
jgi:hypothetical protein